MSYPSSEVVVQAVPGGYGLAVETWYIERRGEKDWRCDLLTGSPVYPTEEAAGEALAAYLANPREWLVGQEIVLGG